MTVDQTTLHPIVAAAAKGLLPEWSRAGAKRRGHVARVAELMDGWAKARGLPEGERARWRAAGYLHDALREAPPEELRPLVPEELRELPPRILHGPAVAERLRREGVDDEELLIALAFHTLGDPRFQALGRALYSADFVEPGRKSLRGLRSALRKLARHDPDAAVVAIAQCRISHYRDREDAVDPRSAAFWHALSEEVA